jgi:DNA-binding GntR family transcriptional regulator
VLERLRWVDGVLTVYDVNYLLSDLADVASTLEDDAHGSLYDVLAHEGLTVAGGRRIVDSVIAGQKFADILEVSAWEPLLVIEGIDWDHNLRAFDCYRTWIRPDRMKIEVRVMPSDPVGSAA